MFHVMAVKYKTKYEIFGVNEETTDGQTYPFDWLTDIVRNTRHVPSDSQSSLHVMVGLRSTSMLKLIITFSLVCTMSSSSAPTKSFSEILIYGAIFRAYICNNSWIYSSYVFALFFSFLNNEKSMNKHFNVVKCIIISLQLLWILYLINNIIDELRKTHISSGEARKIYGCVIKDNIFDMMIWCDAK